MASARSGGPASGGQRDQHDDLLNFDAEMEEVFGDVRRGNDPTHEPPSRDWNDSPGLVEALGIDEEIKIPSKKRKPIAKLDVARLESPAGIPKLRRIAKTKLKFRGKGHEFSDIAMLLRTYQLWLDDLYPRAKFADGLAIIEKLGHSKHMQMLRKQWIVEDKPKPEGFEDVEPAVEEFEPRMGGEQANANSPTAPAAARSRAGEGSSQLTPFEENSLSRTTHPRSNEPEEDELDALLAEAPLRRSNGHGTLSYEPGQDELDALLEDESMRASNQTNSIFGSAAAPSGHREKQLNDFEDDEEALRELEMM